jgi:AraC family transcriptional regulator, transcriptional activator FtrA
MKRALLHIFVYVLSSVLPIVVMAGIGYVHSMNAAMSRPSQTLIDSVDSALPPPAYDPDKPTVAIVLGDYLSEVTDVLGPYALFATSEAYNVYTVASSKTLRTLTGNLDIIPHFSFVELETLLGHAPDIIVVPAIPFIKSSANEPVLAWLKKHADTSLLFSWCTGAEVLAEAGLLEGKAATTHWADLNKLAANYPGVNWQRGLRYVDAGSVLTSAGLTSGIDATLYLLTQRNGEALAKRVADDVQYPSFQFVANPRVKQYVIEPSDIIYILNATFNLRKRSTGIWLYDDVDELDLTALFDTHAASWTSQLYTLGSTSVIRSRYGLYLVPRYGIDEHIALNRLLVSGSEEVIGQDLQKHLEAGHVKTITHFQTSASFALGAALQDLAREHDVPTARFAAKRLEYRAEGLELSGAGWPIHLLLAPFLLGVAGLISAYGLLSRLARRRKHSRKR